MQLADQVIFDIYLTKIREIKFLKKKFRNFLAEPKSDKFSWQICDANLTDNSKIGDEFEQ